MNKRRLVKPILLGLLVVFSLLYVLPSIVPGGMPSWYPFKKALNYGLDLKGGLELRYTVDYKQAISDNTLKVREGIVDRLVDALVRRDDAEKDPQQLTPEERKAYLARFTVGQEGFDELLVTFVNAADAEVLTPDFVDRDYPDYVRRNLGGGRVRLRVKDQTVEDVKSIVVDQTLDTIRKRVDAFGLVEPDVRLIGSTDIDVQLPGLSKKEMDVVRERIGQTAQLIFRIVDLEGDFFRDQGPALEAYKELNPDRATTLALRCGRRRDRCRLEAEKKSELIGFIRTLDVPDTHTVGFEVKKDRNTGRPIVPQTYETVWLRSKVELSGDTLSRAMVYFDSQTQEPYVSVEFNAIGARRFADVTRENVGKRMAIMLDDEVTSAPVIQEEIPSGRARITLGSGINARETQREAQELVTVLNQGAYRAPVHRVHDYEVGPSLGRDSIRAGTMSLLVGAIIVVLFILFYYRGSGVIANIALFLNILFILAILVSFDTALTLPGIAGIVLTIGMAVDANVIIFERIREELRAGKTPRVAIDTGYSKAFWTIFDANITTALAGVILLNYTSGAIQGFAKTLLIGIICSMFTAIVVTRMIFRLLLERWKVETLSI